MGVSFSRLLWIGALIGSAVTFPAATKDGAPKLSSLQGKIVSIDREDSTVTVDTKAGSRRLVVYNPQTRLTYGRSKGKESSWEQVRETNYISCAGTYDEKMRLMARECVHKESR